MSMNLHSLSGAAGSTHRRKRVGRGRSSGIGKTCGRGHKGQMARKGASHRPGFEGGQIMLILRLPKRGFKNPTRGVTLGINVLELERFDEGAEVTVELLRQAGLANGTFDSIKILGGGDLSKKLTVKASSFSKSAQAKIEAAGGTCEIVER